MDFLKYLSDRFDDFLFIFIAVYFLDIATTLYGLSRGFLEGTPILVYLLGFGEVYFILVPLLVKMSIMTLLYFMGRKDISAIFLISMIAIHFLAIINNIIILW